MFVPYGPTAINFGTVTHVESGVFVRGSNTLPSQGAGPQCAPIVVCSYFVCRHHST